MSPTTPSQLVEERVVLKADDTLMVKVMKENLVAFLHEFAYFNTKDRGDVFEALDHVSEDARRALARLFPA